MFYNNTKKNRECLFSASRSACLKIIPKVNGRKFFLHFPSWVRVYFRRASGCVELMSSLLWHQNWKFTRQLYYFVL